MPQNRTARRAVVANNIRVDAATAEVLGSFQDAGVEALLLKGPSIARWLYAGTRSYVDSDLWVRPRDMAAAEAILRALGFEKWVDERGLPTWWRAHGSEWIRNIDGVCVDLHRWLPGLGVDAESAWRILSTTTETVVVGGYPARALAPPARALHVVLHAAHHGKRSGKVLADLERALELVDESTWRGAADLAAKLAATEAFAVGLRLLPAGAVLADRLRLPANRSVEVALRASTPPPIALGFAQIARARGLRASSRIVVRKFVPPPGFIRHWYPAAARSRRHLALAYIYRSAWLLRNAPRGYRAWRQARKLTEG